jgi:hypothetical protein
MIMKRRKKKQESKTDKETVRKIFSKTKVCLIHIFLPLECLHSKCDIERHNSGGSITASYLLTSEAKLHLETEYYQWNLFLVFVSSSKNTKRNPKAGYCFSLNTLRDSALSEELRFFLKYSNIKFDENAYIWELRCSMQTDRQADEEKGV